MKNYLDQIKRRGFRFVFKALFWRLKTAGYKRWLMFSERSGISDYERWLKNHQALIGGIKEPDSENTISDRPLFTIYIHSSYKTGLILQTVQSLINQAYPFWEAIILLPPDLKMGADPLIQMGIKDRRIQCQIVHDLGGSFSFKEILSLAQADFVGFLSAGDTFSPGTLQKSLSTLISHRNAGILYFDEDHPQSVVSKRREPFFKPDWSPELMVSLNYLRTALLQRSLLMSFAETAKSFGDAIFRCVEATEEVYHIPLILFHGAFPLGENPSFVDGFFSSDHHLQDVNDHFRRIGIKDPQVYLEKERAVHVKWPAGQKLVTIIIPNKDRASYLKRCVNSIFAHTQGHPFEILIIDNNSHDPETIDYYKELRSCPEVRVLLNQESFNYSRFNNFGAQNAKGENFLFLNNDVEALSDDWLEELIRWTEIPEIGIVGGKLLYPNQTIQHAGIVIGLEGHASHIFLGLPDRSGGIFGTTDWYRNYSAVTGACMLIRRDVFEEVGGFDESYQLVFSDVEICVRAIQAGYRVVYNPFAALVHYEGQTRARYIPKSDLRRGYRDLKTIIERGDPFYNPNLSYASCVPTLKRLHDENPGERIKTILEINES